MEPPTPPNEPATSPSSPRQASPSPRQAPSPRQQAPSGSPTQLQNQDVTESSRDIELEEVDLSRPLNEAPRPVRHVYLDAFRGIIMALMAWDHSLDYLGNAWANRGSGSERWSGPLQTYNDSFIDFGKRSVSHICAPGFFFTMGVSMYMLTQSRLRGGWDRWRITKFFLVRGIVLALLGRIVNILEFLPYVVPYFRGDTIPFGFAWTTPFLGVIQVLFSLGTSMMIVGAAAPFLVTTTVARKGKAIAVFFGVVVWILSAITIVTAQDGNPAAGTPWPRADAQAVTFWQFLVRFMVLPGKDDVGMIGYPIFPWVGLTAFGFALVSAVNNAKPGECVIAGFSLVVAFFIIRLLPLSLLNFRGYPRGEYNGPANCFFTVSKYPPDAGYLTITMGINVMIMGVCKMEPRRPVAKTLQGAALTFGNVALFFYVFHETILSMLGVLAKIAGISLPTWLLLVQWLLLLLGMLKPCRWYGNFKRSTPPESLWRLL